MDDRTPFYNEDEDDRLRDSEIPWAGYALAVLVLPVLVVMTLWERLVAWLQRRG